jgi:molybdate transport system substrate-binding protein
MKKRQVLQWIGLLGLGLALATACRPNPSAVESPPSSTAGEGDSVTLLVGAAASLQEAMEAIQPSFEAAHPGITLEYTFAASGQLQQQIEQGAPIDVFLSASSTQMEALESGGHVLPDSRQDLLSNTLVLVVPSTSTLGLAAFTDLTQAEVEQISVGDFGSVPAGQYAEQVFSHLGILDGIQNKLIFVNTVREVLAAVASNNVDAGVVYATDAVTSDQVTVVATAETDWHDPIVYPIAVINDSPQAEAALTLLAYLSSEAAKTVFIDHGFKVLN